MRTVIKYPGAKWRIADWIIEKMPEHHCYVEPYFGSGAVLFNKQRSNIEVVNDMDDDVINLFECIREDPERLAWLLYATPYSRAEYDATFEGVAIHDPWEKARQFVIRRNMSFGTRLIGGKNGWKIDCGGRERAYAAKAWKELPREIINVAERLRGVQIEHRPALQVIRMFDRADALIYCDPPYVLKTRTRKQYRYEMTDNDHEELLDMLLKHTGKVMISGYENPIYAEKLRGWHKAAKRTYDTCAQPKIEILYMNFEPGGGE